MGKKDTIAKAFLADNHRFADLCNYYLFDGKQVINPDELTEQDTTELIDAVSYAEKAFGISDRSISIQKWRDILKKAIIKYTDKCIYVIIGIENQSEIHYAMPVKDMLFEENPKFNHIDAEAVRAINTFTRFNVAINDNEEVINIGNAWEDHRLSGLREGLREGEQKGTTLKLIELTNKKIQKGCSVAQIADMLEKSVDTIQPIYDIITSMSGSFNAEKAYELLNKASVTA